MKLNQNQKELSAVITNIISPLYNDADLLNTHITAIILLADQIYSKKEEKKPKKKIPIEDVNEIYSAYPTRCVVRGTSTGKSVNNKKKIRTLLKSSTKEELLLIISKYIADCKKDKVYMKNFTTFLNNLPDYDIDTLKTASKNADANTNKGTQWQ